MEADGKRPLPFVADLLSADTLGRYGYFDAKKVGLLLRKATRGSAVSFKDNQALVAIVATQSWHRQFIERHQSFEQLESNRTL
jgi:hypothetical protein